jgi:hypothetical protein
MPVAYSHSRIVVETVDGTTVANLRAGLHSALTTAGWSAASITGGHKYTITTRQGLTAACWIRDLGALLLSTHPCLTVQFGSADGSQMGYEHLLACTAYRTSYQVIANECQMFVSWAGKWNVGPVEESSPPIDALAVCGGVPYIPKDVLLSDCSAPEITEAWWSSGSRIGFRNFTTHPESEYSACFDGELTTLGATDSRLRLAPLAHPYYDFVSSPLPAKTQWFDETPVYTDPLLLWGAPVARVRGQIWDAMLGSTAQALDHEITTEEVDPDTNEPYEGNFVWRNYMHSEGIETHYASLYLLTQVPDGFIESNYAY